MDAALHRVRLKALHDPLVVRQMKKVWKLYYPETGETRECTRLRTLVWSHYEPMWFFKLRRPIEDWLSTPRRCKVGQHKWFAFDYPDDHFEECSECGATRSIY